MNKRMNEWTDELIHEGKDERINKWTNKRMDQ